MMSTKHRRMSFKLRPEGRNFMKSALERREDYNKVSETVTTKCNNPYELNAIPIADAAHRYLLSNKLMLNDWLLAIFAYSVGEGAVQLLSCRIQKF